MKWLNTENIILANIWKLIHEVSNLAKNNIKCLIDKLKLNIINTKAYGYVSLGPTDDAERASEYLRAMEWAINEKDVTNVAVAGTCGFSYEYLIC